MTTLSRPRLAVLATACLFILTGCAGQPGAADSPTPAGAGALSVDKAWVKAADADMTAAFGDLTNSGDTDVTVVSASSPASPDVQLHENVAGVAGGMSMREKEGGFVVPAGKTLELAPGGEHLMLMGLTQPLLAGQEVSLVLTLSDGSTFRFAAPVKDFAGANEHYDDGMDQGR